jgi:hypothetical protein
VLSLGAGRSPAGHVPHGATAQRDVRRQPPQWRTHLRGDHEAQAGRLLTATNVSSGKAVSIGGTGTVTQTGCTGGPDLTWSATAGASGLTCTGYYRDTAADIAAGKVTLQAAVSAPGVAPDTQTSTAWLSSAGLLTNIYAEPGMTAGKLADFKFTVTNTGNVTVYNIKPTADYITGETCSLCHSSRI